jgi:hypothetical protein
MSKFEMSNDLYKLQWSHNGSIKTFVHNSISLKMLQYLLQTWS